MLIYGFGGKLHKAVDLAGKRRHANGSNAAMSRQKSNVATWYHLCQQSREL
jgi:hypothetical protein